jgi:TBC1 domain family member 10
MFVLNEGSGQKALTRLLLCYASVDPEVGYCQGMGFIAAMFLSYMPEDEAFYCLYAVLHVRRKHMEGHILGFTL